MLQGFWKRWHQEYLTTLQQRPKWNTERKNVATGDMSIIENSNTPPAAWTLARIIEVYLGKDGLVNLLDPFLKLPLCLKPSTHIDENRELTLGVSERQICG